MWNFSLTYYINLTNIEISASFNTVLFEFDFIGFLKFLKTSSNRCIENSWALNTLNSKIQYNIFFCYYWCYFVYLVFSDPVVVLSFDSFAAHLSQIEFQMRHFTCDLTTPIFHTKFWTFECRNVFSEERPSGNGNGMGIDCKLWKTSRITSKTQKENNWIKLVRNWLNSTFPP